MSPSETKLLERLYRRRLPFDRVTTPELTTTLVGASARLGRQVGVLVDRAGSVHHVVIGSATGLFLPDLGRARVGMGRLRGLRLIHTHLRNEALTRDDIVDLTRLRLDLVVAICLGHTGQPRFVYYGHNVPRGPGDEALPYQTAGPIPYGHLDLNPEVLVRSLEDEFARLRRAHPIVAKDGRAILVHVCSGRDAVQSRESLTELRELARTAGVEVADEVVQLRERVDPRFVLGRGKLEDVVIRAMQLDAEVLVFDRNLSPAQAAAIARMTDLKVLDRTQLILDIFAQRATTRDGKLQVELAQMRYLLPRLGTRDDALSRLTGGIGGRGPGETKLEIGRRRARERIAGIEAKLRSSARQRQQRRGRRNRRGVPTVAIVGYTNAGKSTLLNTLTCDNALAEDKLFATLDTRTRRLRFPREREVVVSDTVGFIRDMPEALFAAFRSTFEEAQDADLLLHVIDMSSAAQREHIHTTEYLIERLGLGAIPRLDLYNKADCVDDNTKKKFSQVPRALVLSARDAKTLTPLLVAMEQVLFQGAPLLSQTTSVLA